MSAPCRRGVAVVVGRCIARPPPRAEPGGQQQCALPALREALTPHRAWPPLAARDNNGMCRPLALGRRRARRSRVDARVAATTPRSLARQVLGRHGIHRCVACLAPERAWGQAAVVAATFKLTRLTPRAPLHTAKIDSQLPQPARLGRRRSRRRTERHAAGVHWARVHRPPLAAPLPAH